MTARLDDPDDPWQPTRLAILVAASAGDAGATYRLIADLMGEGVPFSTILFEVFIPLEAEVGKRWQQGDFGVADEHLVTATLETVVSLLAGSFDIPDDARRVVVTCAEGDTHSLPARMVAAYLVFLGWRAVFLGPSQPASELRNFLRERRSEALILSCAMTGALPGARECIRVAHEAGIPVLAGGRGFGPDGARAYALGADAWTADPARVDEILRTWDPDPAAAEFGARDGGKDLFHLRQRRAELLARAEATLVKPDGPVGDARLGSDLDLVLDALAASLLLGDPEVMVEFVDWDCSRVTALPRPDPTALVAALRTALRADLPSAIAFLDAAIGRTGASPRSPE
ncbi:MAG TPA: cobalamin-dependent protein [Acidimicrobiia bacterium]|nr:cobalamin-dependent protein [Acidimicrobiia bacterium]